MVNADYRALKPWTCRACGGQFRFSDLRGNLLGWGSLGVSAVLPYFLGVRGITLVLAAAVLWFPMGFLFICVFDQLFRPKLQPYARESRESIQRLFTNGSDSELSEDKTSNKQ